MQCASEQDACPAPSSGAHALMEDPWLLRPWVMEPLWSCLSLECRRSFRMLNRSAWENAAALITYLDTSTSRACEDLSFSSEPGRASR